MADKSDEEIAVLVVFLLPLGDRTREEDYFITVRKITEDKGTDIAEDNSAVLFIVMDGQFGFIMSQA